MKRCVTMGLVLAVLLAAGCLEREETVTVQPDGAVDMTVTVKADQADELAPGRVPTAAAGWQVIQTEEKQDDGKSKHVVTAAQSFAPGSKLPGVDGDPNDADADLYIHYPTTVTVEQRDDATYYHFRRVYPARSFAQVHLYEDAHRDTLDRITSKPHEQITDDEWRQVIALVTQANAHRKLELAKLAVNAVTPKLPQDRWLAVFDKVAAIGDDLDTDALIKAVRDNDENAITAQTQLFDQRLRTRLDDALTLSAGYTAAQMDKFHAELARVEKRQQITDDVQSTGYTVRLTLPGEILGSNADETAAGGALVWRFDGKWMLDRDMVLLASSRVPR